jgi:hypothetical protein
MKQSPFYLKAQIILYSEHLPPQLYKPVIEGCIGKISLFYLGQVQKIEILREKNVEFLYVVLVLVVCTVTARL